MLTSTDLILIIIALCILLLWGPSKLPQLAQAIGQAMYEFKKAKEGVKKEVEEVKKEIV